MIFAGRAWFKFSILAYCHSRRGDAIAKNGHDEWHESIAFLQILCVCVVCRNEGENHLNWLPKVQLILA